jgi:hypothetical protein
MPPVLYEMVCDMKGRHSGWIRYKVWPEKNAGSSNCMYHGCVSEPYDKSKPMATT